jgi:Polyphosphate kinase 2 (PPK2)
MQTLKKHLKRRNARLTRYGRVLVERVEGFATEKEWRRAYREINEFELMLSDSGIRLVKLFLHITPDEQIRRFRDRLFEPVKRWKLSYERFPQSRPVVGLRDGNRGHDRGDRDKTCTVASHSSKQ